MMECKSISANMLQSMSGFFDEFWCPETFVQFMTRPRSFCRKESVTASRFGKNTLVHAGSVFSDSTRFTQTVSLSSGVIPRAL